MKKKTALRPGTKKQQALKDDIARAGGYKDHADAIAHLETRKGQQVTRYAICGKCHKYHREGTKIAKDHQAFMGGFQEIDPGKAYGTR